MGDLDDFDIQIPDSWSSYNTKAVRPCSASHDSAHPLTPAILRASSSSTPPPTSSPSGSASSPSPGSTTTASPRAGRRPTSSSTRPARSARESSMLPSATRRTSLTVMPSRAATAKPSLRARGPAGWTSRSSTARCSGRARGGWMGTRLGGRWRVRRFTSSACAVRIGYVLFRLLSSFFGRGKLMIRGLRSP